eukprot:gene12961-7536_t
MYIPKSFKSKYPDRYLNILRKARKHFKNIETRYFLINREIQKEKKKLGIKTKKTKEPKEEPKKDELKQYTTHIGLWKVAEKEKKRKGQIILMRELSYTINSLTFGQITINNRRLIDTTDENNGRDQYNFNSKFLTPSDGGDKNSYNDEIIEALKKCKEYFQYPNEKANIIYADELPKLGYDEIDFVVLSADTTSKIHNNQSIVLKIKEFSIMIPGDAEGQIEKQLLKKSSEEIKSAVLVASHHGSITNETNTVKWLLKVNPFFIIVSSGLRKHWLKQEMLLISITKMMSISLVSIKVMKRCQTKLKNAFFTLMMLAIYHLLLVRNQKFQ